MSVKKIKRQ